MPRPRLRFSLAGFFFVVTLVAILLSLAVRPARLRQSVRNQVQATQEGYVENCEPDDWYWRMVNLLVGPEYGRISGIRVMGKHSDNELNGLLRLSELEWVELYYTDNSDDFLAELVRQNPKLHTANLSGTFSGDRTCAALTQLDELQDAHLVNTDISRDLLEELRDSIGDDKSLTWCPVDFNLRPAFQVLSTTSYIAPIKGKSKMFLINTNSQSVDDERLAALAQLKQNVSALTIGGSIDQRVTQVLSEFTRLESLRLHHAVVNSLDWLAELKNLQKLSTSWLEIQDGRIPRASEMTSLQSVAFYHGAISNEVIRSLRECPSLTAFKANDVVLTVSNIQEIANLAQLRKLHFVKSSITDSDTQYLTALSGLESLTLSETAISDAAIAILCELDQLKRLVLRQTAVGDGAVPYLKQLTKLEWLSMTKTNITPAAADDLFESLPKLEIFRLDDRTLSRP